MAHARPEYAIVIAVIGVLLAIGVPSLRREPSVVGWVCIGLAALVAAWSILAIWRERR